MALTGAELVDEVRANVGREGSSDTGVITDTRVLRWINDGQKKIANKVPGILQLTIKCVASVDATAKLSYPLSDWTTTLYSHDSTTTNLVNHIFGLSLMDGASSRVLSFIHTDEWDKVVDPTSTDYGTMQPAWYTRRGDNLEIRPLPSSGDYDKTLRLDCDFYPVDYSGTTTDTSAHIPGADEGLIMFGTSKALRAIGDARSILKAKELEKEFSNPMPKLGETQGWLEDFQQENDELHEWNGDLFSDYLFDG